MAWDDVDGMIILADKVKKSRKEELTLCRIGRLGMLGRYLSDLKGLVRSRSPLGGLIIMEEERIIGMLGVG